MNKFIVTGPESSGKTTLAKNLSNEYNLHLVSEYARDFLNKNKNHYSYTDLLKIAKKQYTEEYITKENCICDTDLITIKIWSEFKYQKCDPWIKEKIKDQTDEKRIYLLCQPDIKWQYDPQRENKYNRDEIFNLYIKEIKCQNHFFTIINGEDRFKQAKQFIDKII